MPSFSSNLTLMTRWTPLTSTLASDSVSSTMLTTWPGIPRHMAIPFWWRRLADARERVADKHVDDPAAAEWAPQRDHTGRLGLDDANDRGALAAGRRAQGCDGGVGLVGGHDSEETTLVRDVERVDTEHFAGPVDGRLDRQGEFVEHDGASGGLRQLVGNCSDSATGGVAHPASRRHGRQQCLHEPGHCCGVRLDVGLDAE